MRFVPLLLFIVLLTGCTGTSRDEVRVRTPLQSGLFQQPYAELAICVKDRIETNTWPFGQPFVHIEAASQPIRVYASYSRSTLFELTFLPVSSTSTHVEYRRSQDGRGTEGPAWSIIEQCTSRAFLIPTNSGTGQ